MRWAIAPLFYATAHDKKTRILYWTDPLNDYLWSPREERLAGLAVINDAAAGPIHRSFRRVESNFCRSACSFEARPYPKSEAEASVDADVVLVSAKLLKAGVPLSWLRGAVSTERPLSVLYWRETYWAAGAFDSSQLEFDLLMGVFFSSSILNPSFFPPTSATFMALSPFEKRDRFALFVSSHCGAQPRSQYIAQLARYIAIDTLGACGDLALTKGVSTLVTRQGRVQKLNANDLVKHAARYKFWLCFENSIADGYVSEKLLKNALIAGVLPVYLGAPDVADLPSIDGTQHAWFIDAAAYTSPKHLADHLNLVASNKTLWNTYFAWRTALDVTNRRRARHPFVHQSTAVPVRDALNVSSTATLLDLDAISRVERTFLGFHVPLIKERVAAMCRLCDLEYLHYLKRHYPLKTRQVHHALDAMHRLGLNLTDVFATLDGVDYAASSTSGSSPGAAYIARRSADGAAAGAAAAPGFPRFCWSSSVANS